jgi:hypothetical protein
MVHIYVFIIASSVKEALPGTSPGPLHPSPNGLEPRYNLSSQAEVIPKMGQNSFYQRPHNIAIQLTPSTNKWALVVTTTDVISLVKRVGNGVFTTETDTRLSTALGYTCKTTDWAFISNDTLIRI